MKTKLAISVALAILVLPAICLAAPGRPGPYVSGFIGASIATDIDVPGTDFLTGTNFDDRVAFDPGINIGGTGGYDFGVIRLEGELSYKHAEIKSITDQTGYRYRRVDGSLGTFAMMFNGFVDLHNESRVTPYVGGGIGFAAMHLSDTHGTDTRLTPASSPLLYGEGDDTVFAYQIGAGLDIAMNRHLSLDVGYRYFATDRANFDSDRNIATSMKLESHNATVGVRFKF